MSAWWSGLSLRERILVAGAGAITALVVIWYGLMAPALSARADARANRQAAADQLAEIERLLTVRRAHAPSAATTALASAPGGEAFKAEVTRAAQAAGLSISRLQGSDASRFALVFEAADPRQLFYWLNEIETRLGAQVERLSVDQAGNGRVRATVDVSTGAAS